MYFDSSNMIMNKTIRSISYDNWKISHFKRLPLKVAAWPSGNASVLIRPLRGFFSSNTVKFYFLLYIFNFYKKSFWQFVFYWMLYLTSLSYIVFVPCTCIHIKTQFIFKWIWIALTAWLIVLHISCISCYLFKRFSIYAHAGTWLTLAKIFLLRTPPPQKKINKPKTSQWNLFIISVSNGRFDFF